MNYYYALCVIHVANSTLLLLLVVALIGPKRFRSADAILCYSCSGTCMASQHCNCQTGTCEGSYCYTDLQPSGEDMKLNKGCAKKAPEEDSTCFLLGENRHLRCYCKDQFCNSEYPKIDEDENKHAFTCQQCSMGEAKCSDTCAGDYCRNAKIGKYCVTNTLAQRYECKYGQPFYPYLYIDPASKNRMPREAPICVTMRVDKTLTTDECICAESTQCQRPLVVTNPSLVACYTCDLNSRSELQPTECRDRKCLGNFCVLELFTEFSTKLGKTVRRVAGCLNTTSPDFVRTGCDQQWIEGSKEVIQCACAGHYCNSDLQTAAQVGGLGSVPDASFLSLVMWLFITFSFAKSF